MTDRRLFYEQRAPHRASEAARGYHQLLERYYAFYIPPGQRVLEVGCGLGDLLAAVKPARGLGIDFSEAMVELARVRHPELEFHVADAGELSCTEQFDYIVLSDLVNDLADVQDVLTKLLACAHSRTRLLLNFFNNLWRPILAVATTLGFRSPTPPQNWLANADMKNLLHLAGWELVKTDGRILWPVRTPVIAPLFNRWLAPFLKHLCLTIFQIARPKPHFVGKQLTCSIIIPARNEADNIEPAVMRTADLGAATELIFVEGHSRDRTWEEILRVTEKYPQRKIKALKQTGQGKGNAIREAFAIATGDLLFILDGDLTMPPEELPKFYEVARSGAADFVNGARLVYPMEDQAMQFLNMIANKCFGIAFSWLLGQSVKDTLCGTKVLFRSQYELIARNRSYFGDFDPFGDFDLLFGAAKLNLRIIDLPIRYRARTYGETNISRWKHGWLLLRMTWFAARRLKFFT
ncbi:MAG TPA: glycosyltransferase [Chthoniobacterales bacterium]|nr:glycosyltransferase [Chthoniobacterales bacterium]